MTKKVQVQVFEKTKERLVNHIEKDVRPKPTLSDMVDHILTIYLDENEKPAQAEG